MMKCCVLIQTVWRAFSAKRRYEMVSKKGIYCPKEICDSELEGILVSNRHTKCPNEIRKG